MSPKMIRLSIFLLYVSVESLSKSLAQIISKPSSLNPKSNPPHPANKLTTVGFSFFHFFLTPFSFQALVCVFY